MNSISSRLSKDWTPTSPNDFAGPPRQMAGLFDRLQARQGASGEPIRILCKGEPGVGKSALAKYFIHRFGVSPFNVHKYNGTQVTIERLNDIAQNFAYRLSGWTVLWIDEADKIPATSQVRMLTVLDDLPKYVAVLFTSNADLKQLEQRFHSRGYCLNVTGPTYHELVSFLQQFTDDVGLVRRVAHCACNLTTPGVSADTARADVRQALNDLDMALLMAEPLAA